MRTLPSAIKKRDGRPEIAVGHVHLDADVRAMWLLELAAQPRIHRRDF